MEQKHKETYGVLDALILKREMSRGRTMKDEHNFRCSNFVIFLVIVF